LGRIRLSDGRVLGVREKAFTQASQCMALHVGAGFGFVCSEPQGRTRVFAFEPPLSVRPLAEFEGPRAIAESGNGALAIHGRCAPKSMDVRPGVHCILTPEGERWELEPVVAEPGMERVVALRDGSAAWIVPPRLDSAGSLVLASSDGKKRSVPLA